jgi:hypothetical protein
LRQLEKTDCSLHGPELKFKTILWGLKALDLTRKTGSLASLCLLPHEIEFVVITVPMSYNISDVTACHGLGSKSGQCHAHAPCYQYSQSQDMDSKYQLPSKTVFFLLNCWMLYFVLRHPPLHVLYVLYVRVFCIYGDFKGRGLGLMRSDY